MNFIKIKNNDEVLDLAKRIKGGELFCDNFKFKRNDYFDILLSELNIDKSDFYSKYYYYDGKIHIAKSNLKYFLISTMGLVIFKEDCKAFDDKIFTSLSSQYELMQMFIEKIEEYKETEAKFNINTAIYEKLMNFSITFFHNYLFYLELLCKYYIASNKKVCSNTHSLIELVAEVKNIMFDKKQNDSLFHYLIVREIERTVDLIKKIPGNFKEQYVKYNDNENDNICIKIDDLNDFFNFIISSYDVILQYKWDKNCKYMEQGFYEKKLSLAKNKEEKEEIEKEYRFLIEL